MTIETILAIFAGVFVLVEGLGIVAALHAVMNATTSQGAIAWGISLVTFPWLALPLYAVFGRKKFHGYTLLRHAEDEKIHHIIEKCSADATENQIVQQDLSAADTAMTRLADMPITLFNHSELLIDGQATFQSIFEIIAKLSWSMDYMPLSVGTMSAMNTGRATHSSGLGATRMLK